jgi:CTP:molybdopterin cytidylyltransferase MocA
MILSCILLSAGLSSRFGVPKALARINHETVIEYLQKLLLATDLTEIIVVLGHRAHLIKPLLFNHKRIRVVHNKDYKLGQTSSFQAGLREISSGAEGIMLFPIDYPMIRKGTLEELIAYFWGKTPTILVPAWQGRRGHPPIFHARIKEELLSLGHFVGVNTIIRRHQTDTVLLPMDDRGVIQSFNTQEEFDQLKTGLIC